MPGMLKLFTRICVLTLFAVVPSNIWWTTSDLEPDSADSIAPSRFAFYQEFYGPKAYSDPGVAQNLSLGMMTGLTFTPPVDFELTQLTGPYRPGLMLRLAAAPLPAGMTGDAIDLQRAKLTALAEATPGVPFFWDLLPEWDQSGGLWVAWGRPRYQGLSRFDAHKRFLDYYESAYPNLIGYLREPASSRKYQMAAVTDNTPNVFDAYELGADLQLLERGIDELGDLPTGIAFLRGAANQYHRAWGVDVSTWRTSNGKATAYSESGALQGGWSASYLRRLYYMSFLAGAQIIQNEPAIYRYSNGRLNPFGDATQEFANFALRQHPELGHPLITTAVLVNPDCGFDPKHGIYNQSDAVWYHDIPYSAGDFMMNEFFRLAYPGHWLHGLAPRAPFADAAGVPNPQQFRAYLAAGMDPRPYEPQPTTRWGDQLDVITTRVREDALAHYAVIILLGDVSLDSRLRGALSTWVNKGGVLLMNSAQAAPEDQVLSGLAFDSSAPRMSASFRWMSTGPLQEEHPFRYSVVHPTSAEVWAVSGSGDPLITSNRMGAGQVLFATPSYLRPASGDGLLAMGVQLLDGLFQEVSRVEVSGPPVAYVVNEITGKIVVAISNPSGSPWEGDISTHLSHSPDKVSEYVTGQRLSYQTSGRIVTIHGQVPPYEVRVFAVEYSGSRPIYFKPSLKHAVEQHK